MMYLQVALIGVALAMDAFSIALSKGLAAKKLVVSDAVKLGVTFGIFQAVMPFIGWAVGSSFYQFVESYAHLISFVLLAFIGIKMIYECFKGDETTDCSTITVKNLIILGIATSIDALAVGFTFSANSLLTVLLYCAIIGTVTMIISFFGYFFGGKLGEIVGARGELIGGIVLILIGLKMLIEHYI